MVFPDALRDAINYETREFQARGRHRAGQDPSPKVRLVREMPGHSRAYYVP